MPWLTQSRFATMCMCVYVYVCMCVVVGREWGEGVVKADRETLVDLERFLQLVALHVRPTRQSSSLAMRAREDAKEMA